jgi:hypothetical protein
VIQGAHGGRFESALGGAQLRPPVRGLSFVDPRLLPGPEGPGRSAAAALAQACADLQLDFAFVPSWEEWAPHAVDALWREGVAPLWVVPGVVWPALESLGVEAGLRASVCAQELMLEAMDAALVAATRSARAGVEAGAHGLVVADDMAGASGPLLSRAFLHEHAFPRLEKLVAVARGVSLPAVLHCDGDARSLFAAAGAAGFRAVHGDHGGAEGLPLALGAACYGPLLIGGIPTGSLGDPAAGARAGATAASLAKAGGLLISDDGGITTREQVAALFSALGAARA